MSIAKEIERLFNTKGDLKEVIANKGVTIPEGTLIDEYYKYVDMITTGANPDAGRDDEGGLELELTYPDDSTKKQFDLNGYDFRFIPDGIVLSGGVLGMSLGKKLDYTNENDIYINKIDLNVNLDDMYKNNKEFTGTFHLTFLKDGKHYVADIQNFEYNKTYPFLENQYDNDKIFTLDGFTGLTSGIITTAVKWVDGKPELISISDTDTVKITI